MKCNQSKDIISVQLEVLVDGVPANGLESNQVRAKVLSIDKQPLANQRVVFSIKEGSALFKENQLALYAVETDRFGQALADVTNTIAEDVVLTCSVISASEIQAIETLLFTEVHEKFKIKSVQTLNHSLFVGEPTVVWTGASFEIITEGGTGSANWQVVSQQEYIHIQNGLHGSVIVEIVGPFIGECKIIGRDETTEEEIEYRFSVGHYLFNYRDVKPLSEAISNAPDNKLVPKEVLNSLYAQWGSMLDYTGWTNHILEYWTNQYSMIENDATVFDISTGLSRKISTLTPEGAEIERGYVYMISEDWPQD